MLYGIYTGLIYLKHIFFDQAKIWGVRLSFLKTYEVFIHKAC